MFNLLAAIMFVFATSANQGQPAHPRSTGTSMQSDHVLLCFLFSQQFFNYYSCCDRWYCLN